MRLLLLLYLEDDERTVERLLERHGVVAFSRASVEGHGPGAPSPWSGDVAPYRSALVLALVGEGDADRLLEAIVECEACAHPEHPLHAIELDVRRSARSRTPGGG